MEELLTGVFLGLSAALLWDQLGSFYTTLCAAALAVVAMVAMLLRRRRAAAHARSSVEKRIACSSEQAASAPPLPTRVTTLRFRVNGNQRVISAADAGAMLLATYLREHERLTGVKLSCREGGCGACTVLLRRPGERHAVAINACLRLLAACDGCEVTTVEGIGSAASPHPFQRRLANANGSQCGFCSPGMVAAIVGLLETTGGRPSAQQVEHALDGNLCRCTGYRRILDAAQELVAAGQATARAAVDLVSQTACDGSADECCEAEQAARASEKVRSRPRPPAPLDDIEDLMKLCHAHDQVPPDPARPGDRPAAHGMRCNGRRSSRTTPIVPLPSTTGGAPAVPSWYAPTTLAEAMSLLTAIAGSELVGANTGVAKYYDGRSTGGALPTPPSAYIATEAIAELSAVLDLPDGSLTLGAAVPLATLLKLAEERATRRPGCRWAAVASHLHRVANTQVRAVGTVGGNLMLAHAYGRFPSDVALLLSVLGATVSLCDAASHECVRSMAIPAFYATRDMAKKLLVAVHVPAPPSTGTELVFTYKVALRAQNAHALIHAGFAFVVDSRTKMRVSATRAFYGGLRQHEVTSAAAAAVALVGKPLGDPTALGDALAALGPLVTSLDPVFGRDALRAVLVRSLFFKGWLRACAAAAVQLPANLDEAARGYVRPLSSGASDVANAENRDFFPVSKPTPKLTELAQCTGELLYTDDLPRASGQLYGAFALAHTVGTLERLDTSTAAAAPGVVKVLTATDVKQAGFVNTLSTESAAEELLVTRRVPHAGARLALVLARSREAAEAAARLVRVSISPPSRPPVVTFDDAIAAKAFFAAKPGELRVGDAAAAMKAADVVASGRVECGNQYHFYMETQTAAARSDGTGGVIVDVSMQFPAAVAAAVARCLHLPQTKVEARMARAGGGYGGKATRSVPCAVAAACASWLLDAPCVIALPLNDNMAMLGSRRPHRLDYTVGAAADGTILAVTGTVYAIQGCNADLGGMLTEALDLSEAIDGPYRIANWSIDGHCCRTDTPANTFCRGPVWLPAHLLIEGVIESVAAHCNLDAHDVRLRNLYRPGDVALGRQLLPHCTLPSLVAEVCHRTGYDTLRANVEHFNARSRYVKQGLAISPFRYGMGSGAGYAAMVSIRDDGSVVVSQSGCEIGQGLYVKQAQVAALTLGVDVALVSVEPVTSKLSTGPTGGSTTSEGNAASVRLACEQVLQKLSPVRTGLEGRLRRTATWAELVAEAVRSGADKTGYAQYSGHEKETTKGGQVVLPGASGYGREQYCAFGVALTHIRCAPACLLVSAPLHRPSSPHALPMPLLPPRISPRRYDALSAELTLLRTELVTDQGYSLNPLIDAGQVQGAFTMGLGYVLSEQMQWAPGTGLNLSNGTWEYKPPSSLDIPVTFNVAFLPGSPNAAGIFSSKAVGEPAILAAASVLSALSHAIREIRKDEGIKGHFDLSAPAVPEEVQRLCALDWKAFASSAS